MVRVRARLRLGAGDRVRARARVRVRVRVRMRARVGVGDSVRARVGVGAHLVRVERVAMQIVVEARDQPLAIRGVLVVHAAEDNEPPLVQHHAKARARRGRGSTLLGLRPLLRAKVGVRVRVRVSVRVRVRVRVRVSSQP